MFPQVSRTFGANYFYMMNSALNGYINNCIANHVFPGCALGILRQGKQEILTAGRQIYDPDAAEVSKATIYDVASITKAVPTACLALQLVEQGILALETPLVDLVPECTGRYLDRATVRHLLTHNRRFGQVIYLNIHDPARQRP